MYTTVVNLTFQLLTFIEVNIHGNSQHTVLLCKSDNKIYDNHTILYFNIVCNSWAKHEKNLPQCIARKYHELQSIYIYM